MKLLPVASLGDKSFSLLLKFSVILLVSVNCQSADQSVGRVAIKCLGEVAIVGFLGIFQF